MKNEIKRNERIESKLSEVANIKAAANEYNQHILNALEEIARTENLINNQTVKVFKIEKEIEILTAAAENSADAKETDKIQFDIECKTREIENAKNLVKGYNQCILNAIAKIGVHEDVISRMGIEISAAMKEIEDLQASIVEVIEVDVTEYAVSPDAQEVAVQAEIDNATREVAMTAEKLFAYGVQANRPVFGSVPSGYVKIDKYETEFKIRGVGYVFAVAYYEKPLEEKDIIGYDLVDIAAKRKAYEALHTPEAMAKAEEERKEHHKQLIKERIMRNCAAFEKGLREIDAKIAKLQDEMFSLSGTEETKKELDKLIVKRGKIATNYENEKAELASLEGEVDVTEYAVSLDAQEVAVQAEVDNAACEVAVEEVTTTADLEKQLSEVQTAMSQNDWDIRYRQIRIENNKKFLAQALAVIEETENDILEDEEQISAYEKHKEELQASAEKLQAEITNRKLNAAAVGMVDDGTNEDDDEEMTIDYNFDDEDSDDELVDPPIEYHVEFEIPAAVELEPVTFALERFGEDSEVEKVPAKFEVGKIYHATSVLFEKNYTSILVVKRTEKFVTFVDYCEGFETDYDETMRARILTDNSKGEYVEVRNDFDGYNSFKSWHTEPPKFSKKKNCYYFEDTPYIDIADYADDEEINAEESAPAKIDTAVTEVPIDEDAEIKALESEFDAKTKEYLSKIITLDAEVIALRKEIQRLKDIQAEKWSELCDVKAKAVNHQKQLADYIFEKLAAPITNARKSNGNYRIKIKIESHEIFFDVNSLQESLLNAKITDSGEIVLTANLERFGKAINLATYKGVESFKAAIEGLVAAIERGDEDFTFPTNA